MFNLASFKTALDAENDRQNIADHWQASGSGFGFLHRAIAGMSLVEVDYDYPAKLGDVPRWVAIVWKNATAFDFNEEGGKLAVIFCDAPRPNALDAEGLARLARFAVGSLRLASAVELVAEGK